MYDLKSTVYQLHGQIQKLSFNINAGDNADKNPNTCDKLSNRNPNGNDRHQHVFNPDKIAWTTGLLFSNDWTKNRKDNYTTTYKRMEPNEYKKLAMERMVKYQARELAKLDKN